VPNRAALKQLAEFMQLTKIVRYLGGKRNGGSLLHIVAIINTLNQLYSIDKMNLNEIIRCCTTQMQHVAQRDDNQKRRENNEGPVIWNQGDAGAKQSCRAQRSGARNRNRMEALILILFRTSYVDDDFLVGIDRQH